MSHTAPYTRTPSVEEFIDNVRDAFPYNQEVAAALEGGVDDRIGQVLIRLKQTRPAKALPTGIVRVPGAPPMRSGPTSRQRRAAEMLYEQWCALRR